MIEFESSSGLKVPVELRRRKGTRHMRLSLGRLNQIVVSLPWRCPEDACARFIEINRAWLEQEIAAAPRLMTVRDWLLENPYISSSGDRLLVSIKESAGSRLQYTFECGGSELHFHLPGGRAVDPLGKLVRAFAKDTLSCRVAYQAKRLGLHYEGLSVRDQASRWGSCSAGRTISLNWRLVLLEPTLQDYIILHELAHLSELNHSRRFWDLLDQYDPARLEHERRLDELSRQLMRVGHPPCQ